jgi:hypothetical protein
MKAKKILFGCILLFMTLPWLQQEFKLVDIQEMGGAFTKTLSKPFSVDTWLDGSFQETQEKYVNENFGFRNTCVRLNNQVAFSLFNYARSNGVIVGKDSYLYGDSYIQAYYGNDFIGTGKIADNIRKLSVIRAFLKKKNIDLIVVFVPGKASFFPEFLPAEPKYQKKITNYSVYKDQLKESGIPFMDLCSYFIGQKYKSPYPLFPKTGIHWSVYCSELAADSISRFIGKIRNTEAPRVLIKSVVLDKNPRGTDDDIEVGMNLLFRIPKFKMGYPVLDVVLDHKTRPRVLTIADSYFWGIYGSGRAGQIFDKPHFWYYYNELYVPEQAAPIMTSNVDLKKEIEQQDVIMILANDARALDLGSGFIDAAYDLYANGGKMSIEKAKAREEIIIRKMGEIKADKDWYELLKKTAMEKHETVDFVLRENATYIYDKENPR